MGYPDIHPAQENVRPISPELAASLARLGGLFSADELNLGGGEPVVDTFPEWIGKMKFWRLRAAETGQLAYGPAVRHYLRDCLGRQSLMSFEDYLRVWVDSFYATRLDHESARDILLGFLYQNLDILKHLYLLSLPHNHDLAPTDTALNACFSAPENEQLFIGSGFSTWVLKVWLPCHLRHYHCQDEQENTVDAAPIEWEGDASVISEGCTY
jgi:hypothetical protein